MSANASQNPGKVTVQEALDFAIQHHTEGRLLDAKSVYEKILRVDPKQPIALHLLGVVAHQLGENKVAVDLISKAIEIVPDFAAAYSNFGLALQELGRPEEAIERYQKAVAIDPDFVEAHYNLGNLLKEMGRLDAAVDSYQKAIITNPNYVEAHNNIGTAFRELGRLDEAVASYNRALEVEDDYVEAYINLGLAYKALGQINDAISHYRKALALDPSNIAAHNNLGLALKELERVDEALECYRQALTTDPDNAEVLSNLAVALQGLGRLDEAEMNYRRALMLQPGNAEVHYNLCETLERANNTDALQEALKIAKNNCPGDPFLALKEAQLLMRQNDYATGRSILEAAGKGSEDERFLKERAFLLGVLCDRLNDSASAFNYFADGNSRSRTTVVAQKGNGAQSLGQLRALEERFSTDWIATWQCTDSGTDCSDPVFLVGFPRSGTTLLDMILRSHPDVSVLEEQPTLRGVRAALERDHENYQDGLPDLNTEQLSELRHLYFAEVDKFLKPEDRSAVFIDKMPLNIIDVGLIHRIFPRARFLFALRHPCDCVLSCFMQNFKINEGMSHFLDLEDAAVFYDKVMALWQHYQTVLPIDVHTIRYESLIEAFDETLSPLLNFLSLDWHESVRRFAETAQQQGRINTPSYSQVVRPLYTHARYRWESYREQMRPVLPILLPWAKKYGYET